MYYVPYVNDFVVFENTPEVKLEDTEYIIVRQNDILAVVE